MKMYYTFGMGQVDPKTHERLKNKYVTVCSIPGDYQDGGRHLMLALYRDQWSMEYNEDQFRTRFGAMVDAGDMTEHGHYNWEAIFLAGQEVAQHTASSKEDEQLSDMRPHRHGLTVPVPDEFWVGKGVPKEYDTPDTETQLRREFGGE